MNTTSQASTSRSSALESVFQRDFPASIVVFLVALPLCMGIAVACGAPPAVGIITGIVGGVIVGSMAGCPLQVSGPAAGLIVIVAELIREHGLAGLGMVVLLAGAMQVIAGGLKLGQVFRAVAPAVIRGMLAGIGVLIFASQFHMMVDDTPKGSGLTNLVTIPLAIWKAVIPEEDTSHHQAAMIGIATIVAIVIWKPLAPKRVKFIPAPLVAIVLATALAAFFKMPIRYVDLPDRLWDATTLPASWALATLFSKEILLAAVTVAIVASAETLLCATAVDQLQNGPRTNYDRELAAQGLGNMICGALGALPMTGVIVRSSANVQSGAKTRWSAVMHGFWLLVFVAMLPAILRMVPTSALAALLVYTGYRLVDVKAFKDLIKYGKSEAAIYLVTLGSIVGFDLLTGILIGVALSAAKLIYTFSHLRVRLVDGPVDGQTTLHLDGAATFIRLPRLATALEKVPSTTELHVHFEELDYIDHACLDLLINWEKQHESAGGRLVIDWESLTAKFHSPAPQARANGQVRGAPAGIDRETTLPAVGAEAPA